MESQDELYGQAVWLAETEEHLSMTTLQRLLLIGYNRASRLMDSMIANGLVERYEKENGIGYRRVMPNG